MNLQQQDQCYQMMTRLKAKSRAASSTELPEAERRVTEMINGLLVSKPAKEPEVIDLQEYAKSAAASVPGINKLKVIHDFIRSNGRI